MKTIFSVLTLTLSLNAFAQGVMPVPTGVLLFGNTCEQNQNFDILSDPLLRPFQINLTSLICNDESLYADAFSMGANYQHGRTRCDEIATCSQSVTPEDLKDAEAIISQNIPTVAYLSALTKAVEAGREYNSALYQYEKKHKTKVCADEAIDFNCDHQMRMALATVADSLVDFPEFDRAPLSKDDLLDFIPGKFFSKNAGTDKSLDELKKDCSKKFSLKNVCSQAAARIEAVKKCDQDKAGKNCFDEEQRAWASLTNDFKNSNKQLFLAIEKQLCLPQRLTKSASQSTFQTFSPLFLRTQGQRRRVMSDAGFARTQQILSTAKLNSEKDDAFRAESSIPKNLNAKEQESFSLGDGLNRAARETEFVGVESKDTVSLSDTFSENVKQVLDKNNNLLNNSNTQQNSHNWNTDVINRARELAEEQKIQEEERRRQLAEEEKEEDVAETDKKKKDEISTLTAQIDGLKSKLESMTEKMEELKSKKETAADDEDKQEGLKRDKEILELKKQIAQLEADKKKKEEEARVAKIAEDNRLEREREERIRSSVNHAASFVSSSRHSQPLNENAGDASAVEREKAGRSMAAAYDNAGGGRSPASFGGASAQGTAVSNQLVLNAVGSQATPESNIVYMTPHELQRYPYRLSGNASSVEIEKMLAGNQGSTIILGETEQIVPIVENGKILYDEQGKIKYKRIKIALVKNDKERTQQMAREISSLADLKKEEQKKRDLIRYQEMKKALKVP